ncbi:MAG: hypothetical protein P4L84_37035 [Isosphaeraceae bacterium]|nr:hypothetical protein [Isosphaeraceae bacterium]
MINRIFAADRLPGLKLRLRFGNSGRGRRRTSAARFATQDWLLEDRCLLSDLEMPLAPDSTYGRYDTVSSLSDVLFVGNATVGSVPVKQITLYNNTAQTIYPFLYDPNTGKSTAGGYYDPFDGINQEYRGYIGYTSGGNDYLGLQVGHSITINVPFVFWDSGRAAIATDGANLLPTDTNTSKNSPITNPFFFFYKNLDGTNTARFVVNAASSSGGDGIIMYYHCNDANAALDPGSDAPDQLIEFTIRDKDFLTKVSTPTNPIDSKQLITLINYDVSYVDHLLLPVAMEALDVPVPNTNVSKDYGWIGAKLSYLGNGSLQDAVKAFTSNTSDNGLGTYFQDNGVNLGWPSFFNPNYSKTNEGVGIRIPGGANIFFDSPLAGKRSSYSIPYGPNNHWMLSSAGDGPIQFAAAGTFKTPNKAVLTDVPGIDEILRSLRPGMTVQGNRGVVLGKIESVDIGQKTVFLDGTPNVADGTLESFVFSNPAADPYATKLRDLWYSWAAYYENLYKNFQPEQIQAQVSTDTDNGNNDFRILSFGQTTHPELAVGMQVTGGGITRPTTILKITTVDGVQKVYLSAPVSNKGMATFTFSKPQPIAFADQASIIPIQFSTDADKQFAAAFAATVYETLNVFSTAPRQVPALPGSMEVVGNSIGGNVGFLPTAEPINYVNISADVRDLVKSALRGVPDYTKAPYDNPATWYPAPSLATGGQTYNVYNLDPYVWFVHAKLGLSGYGFSFDDDTADVGANGATKLAIAVGGLSGLNNTFEWTPSAQWGTVSSLATISQGTGRLAGKTIITLQDRSVYNQVRPNDPANSVIGAYVSGAGITPGTNLAATADIGANQFVLSMNAPTTTQPVLLTFTGKPPQ